MSSLPVSPGTHYTFDSQYQRYKCLIYDYQTRQWIFQDWMPLGWQPTTPHHRLDAGPYYPRIDSLNPTNPIEQQSSTTMPTVTHTSQNHATQPKHDYSMPRGIGGPLIGTYSGYQTSHYEKIDPSFYVHPKPFFDEGRVFAVLMNETAGSNATNVTDYNSNKSINAIKYNNNYVYTSVRRFVVVRQRHEFCYACPIFTYSGKATTKQGVRPGEHGIAYSWGKIPQLVSGEGGMHKPPVSVVMSEAAASLNRASRIYYGISHPIQYNVKVKEIGYVHKSDVPFLIGNWKAEDNGDTEQSRVVTTSTEIPEEEVKSILTKYDNHTMGEDNNTMREDKGKERQHSPPDEELSTIVQMHSGSSSIERPPHPELALASNPRAFFKKGRVFMTMWAEPKGFSDDVFLELVRFAVIRPKPTFSICLRISTYNGQATTKPGVTAQDHAAIIQMGGSYSLHTMGEEIDKGPIEVKLEDPKITIDPMSRINLAKPYTVEHNIKIRNIGRVVGDSVGLLDQYFAQSLGLTKP
ncbi:hypothetical protein GQ44DRAFT_711686 [Phaeosphaeriaceae sp. PMI808]|nr:hypothetical protein GQ44DRAFT_711686 [Phaeosphaeriaceae sp. PMI808]